MTIGHVGSFDHGPSRTTQVLGGHESPPNFANGTSYPNGAGFSRTWDLIIRESLGALLPTSLVGRVPLLR